MQALVDRLTGTDADATCRCSVSTDGRTLAVDARDCDGRVDEPRPCRETVAAALATADVRRVRVREDGVDRFYDHSCVDLLASASRFAELVRDEDSRLAERAIADPLAAAEDAAVRAAPIDELAAETGLLAAARNADAPFSPAIAPSIADARIRVDPPEGRLRSERVLATGAMAEIYDVPGDGSAIYHLRPVETELDAAELATLAAAHEGLAAADESTPARAVRSVAPDADVRTLARVLRKHTRGYGILEDCFADPRVSDVYASGPAASTPLWVVVDGEQLQTNVTLAADGVAAIASKLRRQSGQSFSRATPTIDATISVADQRVRAAGLLDPATEGHAFAFRAGGREAFTLPALIENGTLTPAAAGLLSVAVRRNAATLVAGARGAGKTTTLGALLWELPATTRTVVIEDTPELPVETLQSRGRDVQPVFTTLDDGPGVSPTEALRTALRLGESALVLGEVRGEEASVLYEAMRVGASSEAVLGTIHGDGGEDVRERVVQDLGVPTSSFAATDLVVTCRRRASAATDGQPRRVVAIEEVRTHGDDVAFEPLFALGDDGLTATGLLDRGDSRLLAALARPGESYAALREQIHRRGSFLGELAARGTTHPEGVTTAYARREGRPC